MCGGNQTSILIFVYPIAGSILMLLGLISVCLHLPHAKRRGSN